VSASANGGRATDAAEAAAIADVIPAAGGRTAVYSIKSMTGEALGASGAFQLVASLMTIVEGVVPPTVNFSAGDPGSPLRGVSASSRPVSAPVTLINATSCDGIHASLVVGPDEAP
jgi:3-oxoacyl-(acyl-carrier-protein) synthase